MIDNGIFTHVGELFMTRNDLPDLLMKCLTVLGGEGTIVEVCKCFWTHYEEELKRSGDLLYTWQYDIRWAATELRKRNIVLDSKESPKGLWQLAATIDLSEF